MAEKLYYQIDDQVFEAKGEILEKLKSKILETKTILENEQAEADTKAVAKTTAQAKLTALGLTVGDLQALGL
jgi:hypothetical protein